MTVWRSWGLKAPGLALLRLLALVLGWRRRADSGVRFALAWFISTAMAAHLPRLLQAQGLPLATALLLMACAMSWLRVGLTRSCISVGRLRWLWWMPVATGPTSAQSAARPAAGPPQGS